MIISAADGLGQEGANTYAILPGVPASMDIIIVGNGSVTVEPDQPAYYVGDPITLTATADLGWAFTGWSGDLTSTDNPETITLGGNTTVTATFTRDAYALNDRYRWRRFSYSHSFPISPEWWLSGCPVCIS